MKYNNACGFGTGSKRTVGGASITIALMVGLSVFAAGQNVPQNTTGRNPGTQVPPGETSAAPTTAASQTTPEKKMQLGLGGVTAGSFKFGEYNGLQNSGVFGIVNFDFRGGAAYDSKSTWRWRFQGTNLGLEDRFVSLELGKQSKYQLRLVYDEIPAYRSDTFQTPYLGAGSNNLTLPSNWITPLVPQANAANLNLRSLDPVAGTGSVYNKSGVLTPPTTAQLAILANIVATDVPDFQNLDLYTKRFRGGAEFTYSPNARVDIPAGFSMEHKTGRKALGAVTSQVNENAILMPYQVDWNTTQASAAVNYKRKKLYLSFGYYGSFFHNNVNSMTWQDIADTTKSATLSEEPSNQFNQFTATAAYKFSKTAKLVVAGSFGRSTQNEPFLGPSTASNGQLAFGLPRTSLGGLVYDSMFFTKLTEKLGMWDLVASYRLEDRDNQTPVNIYLFQDANETISATPSVFAGVDGLPTGLGSNTNIYENRAYSRLAQQANVQAEYPLTGTQHFQLAYDWQRINRSCTGSWITCADAPVVNENTLGAEWRKSKGKLTGRVDYAFTARRGGYNESAFLALVPMANVVPTGGETTSVYGYMQQTGLTAFGPVAGLPSTPNTGDAAFYSPNNNIVPQGLYGSRNNINEIPGFRRYFVANLDRNHVRADFDWKAKEKFSLEGNGVYNNDNYLHTKYGLRTGTFWTATLDASYAPAEDLVADLFYTYDNQRLASVGDAYGSNSTTKFQGQAGNTDVSGGCFPTVATKNASAKIDPCLNWTKNDRDVINTLGFTIRKENLLAKKLQLAAEVLYTNARTNTGAGGGSYVNNPLALAAPAPPLPSGTPAVFYISAQDYPVISNEELSVRPSATYAITKSAALQGFYWFQQLKASDWAYLGLQYGTGTNYMPTNEKAPSYTVNVAGLSLNWTF
jgi:MtrB/PioB family decaheme-associated outer membrane protein